MIEIKIDNEKTKIQINGKGDEVGYQVAVMAKALAQENRLLAGSLIFGVAQVLTREEIMEELDKNDKASRMTDEFLASVNRLSLKEIERLIKGLDKVDKQNKKNGGKKHE